MNLLETKINALMRLATAETVEERTEAKLEILRLQKNGDSMVRQSDPEAIIRQILLELGAPDHLIGHPYLVQAVLLVMDDQLYINNIVFGLYPKLAAQFNTTASRVERAIRHVIEVTWSRGDVDVLMRYFGNTVSAEKGKPTNGEFVARLANVVKLRMKQ